MSSKIDDRWSVIESNFYQHSYSYDLGLDNRNLFYVAIPRIPVNPKSGWMRFGYYYYDPKYPIELIELNDGTRYTQGLCLADVTSQSNRADFYAVQTAKVGYIMPYVSRRNNLRINTPPPPLFKTNVLHVVSAYTANITTISLNALVGPTLYIDSIYLSFPVGHAPLYFLVPRSPLSSSDIYRIPASYPILLYWW